jgi:predicted RNase H-like HicB family nuclease
MNQLSYSVIIEPDDGAFSVIIPALPEAHTWGETPEHAMEMAREVIAACLLARLELGEDIPPSHAGTTRLESISVSAPVA